MIKGMTARQVARLLVVRRVGNGECRGQVTRIQERKPRPMLAVCQLTDVRGACGASRGIGWRALCWKGEDERGDSSRRRRMLIRGRWPRRSCPLLFPQRRTKSLLFVRYSTIFAFSPPTVVLENEVSAFFAWQRVHC